MSTGTGSHHSATAAASAAAVSHLPSHHQQQHPPLVLPALIKESYVMWYDVLQGQWTRIFLSVNETALSMLHNSSRFARLIKPPIPLSSIVRLYCSVDVADAPERHVPVLGVLLAGPGSSTSRSASCASSSAATEEGGAGSSSTGFGLGAQLFVFRTPERRLMADWWVALRTTMPGVKTDTVEHMVSLRSMLPPQLFGTLFRAHDEKISTIKRRLGPSIPQTVTEVKSTSAAPPIRARVTSLSAVCPMRRPIGAPNNNSMTGVPQAASRGGVGVGGHATSSAAPRVLLQNTVPTSASPQPPHRVSMSVLRTMPLHTTAATRHVDPAAKPAGSVRPTTTLSKLTGPKGSTLITSAGRVAVSSVQKPSTPAVSPSASLQASPSKVPGLVAVSSASSPAVVSMMTVVADDELIPMPTEASAGTLHTTPPPTPVHLSHLHTAADIAAKDAKINEQRSMIDDLSARNMDLEIDHANMTAHVLELEATVDELKANVAEWKRKYGSLQQQLQVQEGEFERRLTEEREALTIQLQEEISQHVMGLKEKWAAREAEYEAKLAEALASSDVSNTRE